MLCGAGSGRTDRDGCCLNRSSECRTHTWLVPPPLLFLRCAPPGSLFGVLKSQRVKFFLMEDYARTWRTVGHPFLVSTEGGEATHLDFDAALTSGGGGRDQARAAPRGCCEQAPVRRRPSTATQLGSDSSFIAANYYRA